MNTEERRGERKMRSYIRFYGPGILECINELESTIGSLGNVAVSQPQLTRPRVVKDSFLKKILGGEQYIGPFDYVVSWKGDSVDLNLIMELIEILDHITKEKGTRYSITSISKKVQENNKKAQSRKKLPAVTFLKFLGPSIKAAVEKLDEFSKEIPLEVNLESGAAQIGEYDYQFIWTFYPTMGDIKELMQKIDAVLQDTGVLYQITTLVEPSETRGTIRESVGIENVKRVDVIR